jgi:xylulokinase
MEIFAAGAVEEGDMTLKLATAGRICVITDKPYPHRHLINYTHISEGLWYPGTATKACAASYRWYRDTFGGDYKEMDKGAESIPIGCEGLVFHPYLNGELTPYGDPMLCADFTGVRATHTKAHFDRAVLEGVCYSLLDCYLAVEEIGMPHKEIATVIGGGAKSPLWRQMVSDALGITLRTIENSDSSLGSAMLAGVALGIFESPKDAVNKCMKVCDTVVPNKENTKKYRKAFERYKKIALALAPIYREGTL